jgi:hypothetical protein
MLITALGSVLGKPVPRGHVLTHLKVPQSLVRWGSWRVPVVASSEISSFIASYLCGEVRQGSVPCIPTSCAGSIEVAAIVYSSLVPKLNKCPFD